MTVREIISDKLKKALTPDRLEITDESHKHAGHAGARPGGETHFHVLVVAQTFNGKSRLERQRLIYRTLSAELQGGVHALGLTTLTPEEAAARNHGANSKDT